MSETTIGRKFDDIWRPTFNMDQLEAEHIVEGEGLKEAAEELGELLKKLRVLGGFSLSDVKASAHDEIKNLIDERHSLVVIPSQEVEVHFFERKAFGPWGTQLGRANVDSGKTIVLDEAVLHLPLSTGRVMPALYGRAALLARKDIASTPGPSGYEEVYPLIDVRSSELAVVPVEYLADLAREGGEMVSPQIIGIG